jgi:hypothetical protein
MKKRYRIVTDRYAGYEVQVWRWWFPFWKEVGFCNTHYTLERAREYAKADGSRFVEYVE